jgi:hypothetical protein
MISWVGRCLWLAARTVIHAVRMARDKQVHMRECVLLTNGGGAAHRSQPAALSSVAGR